MIKQKYFELKVLNQKEYDVEVKRQLKILPLLDGSMMEPAIIYETIKDFVQRINKFILKQNIKIISVNYNDNLNKCIVVYETKD